jgi:hypothetical protein
MKFVDHPIQFKEGVRIIMLALRGKEGGNNKPDRVSKKYITRNPQEFDECMEKLLKVRKGQERIYSTVNGRDTQKAIILFKHRQLDADAYALPEKESFYIDIWNRWISCLQNPACRTDKLFMLDADSKEDEETMREEIRINNVEVVHEYDTKNGHHFILNPFNPSQLKCDVLRNHMMLWAYGDETDDEDYPYCQECSGCGEVGCDGIDGFLNKHVKGKTTCKYEESYIEDIKETYSIVEAEH